jgi:hypothetical protein
MKTVALVLVICLAGYTFLTLHFRKPGPGYRPYEDMRNRANTGRLLSAGYQRIELTAQRPADIASIRETAAPAAGGLPAELSATIVAPPLLPVDVVRAQAAPTADAKQSYPIYFVCVFPDDRRQFLGAELYVKGDQIVITPDFEVLGNGLLARSPENLVLLTVPADSLKPGHYRVTLVGQRTSRMWSLQVH